MGLALLAVNATASNMSLEEKAFEEKVKKAEKTCEYGDSDSCNFLAKRYKDVDDVKSLNYYAKTLKIRLDDCEKKDADSCDSLSTMYNYGQGVQVNKKKATSFLQKTYSIKKASCDNGNGEACGSLAHRYSLNFFLIPQDYYKVNLFDDKGCKLNYAPSCSSLGYRHYNGYHIEIDIAQSVSYLNKAIKLGHERAKKLLVEVCTAHPTFCKE